MMQIEKDFIIKCNNCKFIFPVSPDYLECDTYSYERSMGAEIEYDFTGEVDCPCCGDSIRINIRGFEYPVGAFNYSDSECQGGSFVGAEPSASMYYQLDDYDLDYAYDQCNQIQSVFEYNHDKIKNMNPTEFEDFVADLFGRMGFLVKVTPRTRDGGKDIILTQSSPFPMTVIVECKHWNNKVDVSVVRNLFAVQSDLKANKSIIVTSSKFTRDARKWAERQDNLMSLYDIEDLLKLVDNHYGVL